MDVDNLNECKTCRMVLLLLSSQPLLDLFPVRLCGGHGVVAVAYCIRQQRLCVRAAVLLVEGLAVAECFELGLDGLGLRTVRQEPAGDMAAVLHQVGIIQLVIRGGLLEQRLDDLTVGIVDQNHDVRQLQARALTNLETGRNTLDNRLFGRADERCGTGRVFIRFQIDRQHDAAARAGAAGPALGQHDAGGQGAQRAVLHILLHGLMDFFRAGSNVRVLQINLRQGQTQGRGCVTDGLVSLGPVVRLRGVLVAGDDCPLGQVHAFTRKHDLGNTSAAISHNYPSSSRSSVECLYYSRQIPSTALVFQK